MERDNQVIYGLDELDAVVDFLLKHMDHCKVMTFTGPLGAGKTTLIRALLRKLGVTEPITSPTFAYINMYTTDEGKTVHHFDLYRITNQDEFVQKGFDEYLYAPESLSLIEWPAIIEPLLDHDVCHVLIDYKNDKRQLGIECQ